MAAQTAPRTAIKFEIEHVDKNVSTITFTDDTDKSTAYYLDPSNLSVLLPELLRLAVRWSRNPHLKSGGFSGPQKSLGASRIEVKVGRNERECNVTIYVGDIPLTFLVPIDEFIDKASEFASHVKLLQ